MADHNEETKTQGESEDVTSSDQCAAQNLSEQEGLHMIHLRQALQKAIKKCVESVRYKTVAKQYAFADEKAPRVLRHIIEQFKEQWETSMLSEVENMISQEGLVSLFNELDKLIQNTPQDTENAWRPSGDPEEDVQPHLYKAKLEEKEKLKKLLAAVEEGTESLKKTVNDRKEKLERTKRKIMEQTEMFDKAFAVPTSHAKTMQEIDALLGKNL